MAGHGQRGHSGNEVIGLRHPPANQLSEASGSSAPVRLANYILLCRIGEGGMSRVYKAYDVRDGREVALKLLRNRFARNLDERSRFFREVKVLRRLDHPNVLRAYHSGRRGRHSYIAAEYVDGRSAGDLLAKGPFPIDELVRVAIEVLRALDHAHQRGVLHCDVKPDNILIRRQDACVKLADFGLALWLCRAVRTTRPKITYGTLQYMPPEQIRDLNAIDERSDLYALGATLYHLLTGRVPFVGQTVQEIERQKRAAAYRPVRSLRPEVPPELEAILDWLMAPDPQQRPASAADVLEAVTAMDLAAETLRWAVDREDMHDAHDPEATAWELTAVEVVGQSEWFMHMESGDIVRIGSSETVEQLVRERRISLDTLVVRGQVETEPLPLHAYDRFQHLRYDLTASGHVGAGSASSLPTRS